VNLLFPAENNSVGIAASIVEKLGHCATRFNYFLLRRR
jgi:hypothetical protein